jgi:acetamidase/formamidase
MIAPEDLFIMDITQFTKDLYRMGNSTWPAFTEDRARVDLVVVEKNGIETVLANGNGFSAFDHLTKQMQRPGKRFGALKKARHYRRNCVWLKTGAQAMTATICLHHQQACP